MSNQHLQAVDDSGSALAGIRRRDPTRRQTIPLQVLEIEVLDTDSEELPVN